jgi:hypothetical protein
MRKRIRILNRDKAKAYQWRMFMKVFKWYRPNSVPLRKMEEHMKWGTI